MLRRLVLILVLAVVPVHLSLATVMEYRGLGGAGSAFAAQDVKLQDNGGVDRDDDATRAPCLDCDGDYFDVMCASIPSPLIVIPRQPPPVVAPRTVPLRQATVFSRRPERPQWRLAA